MENIKTRKNLVIVESPAKSKHISEYLKKAGYTNTVVMASVGHISNLKDSRNSYKNTGIFIEDNFKLNLAISDDKKDVVKQLQDQVKTADHVYLMTDGDREGEAIAWSLIKFLKLKPGTYSRSITHEITPVAVINAIENPICINDNLVEAAHTRVSIDKMVGYALSPIAKAYIGAKSVGRCQSAGLKLVVDREKEIENFIPEVFYDLYLKFNKDDTEFTAKYIGTEDKKIQHIKTTADINVIKFKCSENYFIKDIIIKEKYESPKQPFITSTLQQEASNQLGLRVKDIMSLCQKNFENGFITYHRVDSPILSDEFIAQAKPFIENTFGTNNYYGQRQVKLKDGVQNGHEAIRCTDITLTPEKAESVIKNELQRKIYNLIWKRTVQSLMPNAIYDTQTILIENNTQLFEFEQSTLKNLGFKILDSENKQIISNNISFNKNEILQNCKLEEIKKQTQPPARFTEASLVKELQAREIGRPSTFSSIVETVVSPMRGYATLEEKKIVPTEKGTQLSNFLDRSFSSVISLNYTRDMEECLDDIANGDLTRVELLTTFYNTLEESIKNNKENCPEASIEKICPLCGSKMVIRRSRFGKLFYGCSEYPACHGIINVD